MKIDFSFYKNIVILTGAGVSAGSGLETYRGEGGVCLVPKLWLGNAYFQALLDV